MIEQKNESPLFSVVIPSYNRSQTIVGCISSVLGQTEQSFEILVIDDGSTDNTREVVLSIPDERIRYIYQENGGGSKARNTGIDHSRGNYIAFLDSDDVFLPHHLEASFKVLKTSPKICTFSQVVVDRGEGLTFLKPSRAPKPSEHISEYLMCDSGFVQTSTLVVPKELALLSKYDEDISSGQDKDVVLKLVGHGAVLKMLVEPGAVWDDKWSPARLSSRFDPDQRVQWLKRVQHLVTRKAYWAERGWPLAKGYSYNGNMLKALWLYVTALCRGAFRPKIAVVVFLQIVLSKNYYRRLSDVLAKLKFRP